MNTLRLWSACFVFVPRLHADEGMWLFTQPPVAPLKAHGFDPSPAWLDHVMKSSVKMGASGSFVSGDGLVLTNHHVGRGQLQNLSTAERDYLKDGFLACTSAEELKCPTMELRVLESTEDVTSRIQSAIRPGTPPEEAARARRKIIAEIEKESQDKTGLESNVVTLYQGGLYHLYRYKKYTDVRLVFAPESAIAAFGGDPDNFEYPRYCLDVCIFRAYENNQPAKPTHFLKWAKDSLRDGDLVFVSGHPGSTDRLLTQAQVAFQRDQRTPWTLEGLRRTELALLIWGGRSDENARRAATVLLGVQNSRKAYDGRAAALQDPQFYGKREAQEKSFREALRTAGETEALKAFDRIAQAQSAVSALYLRHTLLEGAGGFASQSFTFARGLLRAADERTKPNGERLPAYQDTRRESFERALFSPSPVYEDLETVRLATSLGRLVDLLGSGDATVQRVLAGKSPRDRAAELIAGTHVRDIEFRKKLYAGTAATIAEAKDPLIEFARSIDAESRELQKAIEAQEEIIRQAHAVIAAARFKLNGTRIAPDATGTLRLSFGTVSGYSEEGHAVPPMTNVAGLFARADSHHQHEPFNLPPKWQERRAALNPNTAFNFVSTCDIIGGNSGSPVLNRAGELVGLIFDGNIQSLSLGYAYDDRQARAVAVHTDIILEALRKIYDAPSLADELSTGRLAQAGTTPSHP